MAEQSANLGSLADPFGALAGLAGLTELASAWPAAAALAGGHGPPGGYSEFDECVCGAQMRRGVGDLTYVCGDCARVVDGDTANPEDDAAPHAAPNTARVRIVGKNSNPYQPDLYRSSPSMTTANQSRLIFDEYEKLRNQHIENGGSAFPLSTLKIAADYYGYVQRVDVKRSQNKRSIMAACLYHACLTIGLAPGKGVIAAVLQLRSQGIARGDNALAKYVADGAMPADNINVDPCPAEITTLFACLGLGDGGDARDDAGIAILRKAVFNVVQTAISNSIATSSIVRSKVAGATFIVLCRCKDSIIRPMGLKEFCVKGNIRKNTVERVTKDIDSYHSYFEWCYASAGLDTSPRGGGKGEAAP